MDFVTMDVTKQVQAAGPWMPPNPIKLICFVATYVTKRYKFTCFGVMDVAKTYKLMTFDAMDVTKTYKKQYALGPWMLPNPYKCIMPWMLQNHIKFTRVGAMAVTKPYKIIRCGVTYATKPYK